MQKCSCYFFCFSQRAAQRTFEVTLLFLAKGAKGQRKELSRVLFLFLAKSAKGQRKELSRLCFCFSPRAQRGGAKNFRGYSFISRQDRKGAAQITFAAVFLFLAKSAKVQRKELLLFVIPTKEGSRGLECYSMWLVRTASRKTGILQKVFLLFFSVLSRR